MILLNLLVKVEIVFLVITDVMALMTVQIAVMKLGVVCLT